MKPSPRQNGILPFIAFFSLLCIGIRPAKAAQTEPDLSVFQATVAADKPSFFLGENVLLHYCLINPSNVTGHILVGTHEDNFKVTATDKKGTELPEAPWRFRSPDGMFAYEAIDPGKQWCQSIALTEHVRIDEGGAFVVRVAFRVDNSFENFRTKGAAKIPSAIRAVEAQTTVTFVMPTQGEAQTLIGETERQPAGSLGPDFSAMRYDIYLAPLLTRAQAGNISALRGISRIFTSDATNALIELAKSGTPEVSNQAGGYLKQRLVDVAKTCIDKSPGDYRSVSGSPLNFSETQVSARPEANRFYVHISERATMGKPQGVALDVNFRTGECKNVTNKLE